VALLVASITWLAFLLRIPPESPTLEYLLTSSPKLEPNKAIFFVPGSNFSDELEVTQNCYRAGFQIKNLGPDAIYFPYRGWFSLEIQRSNSTDWFSANQASIGIMHPPLREGSVQDFQVRIPAEASRWRISATYRRYQRPVQVLNFLIRDVLRLRSQFGDQKDYEAVGPVWEIPLRFEPDE
jgi:hypothetical protein